MYTSKLRKFISTTLIFVLTMSSVEGIFVSAATENITINSNSQISENNSFVSGGRNRSFEEDTLLLPIDRNSEEIPLEELTIYVDEMHIFRGEPVVYFTIGGELFLGGITIPRENELRYFTLEEYVHLEGITRVLYPHEFTSNVEEVSENGNNFMIITIELLLPIIEPFFVYLPYLFEEVTFTPQSTNISRINSIRGFLSGINDRSAGGGGSAGNSNPSPARPGGGVGNWHDVGFLFSALIVPRTEIEEGWWHSGQMLRDFIAKEQDGLNNSVAITRITRSPFVEIIDVGGDMSIRDMDGLPSWLWSPRGFGIFQDVLNPNVDTGGQPGIHGPFPSLGQMPGSGLDGRIHAEFLELAKIKRDLTNDMIDNRGGRDTMSPSFLAVHDWLSEVTPLPGYWGGDRLDPVNPNAPEPPYFMAIIIQPVASMYTGGTLAYVPAYRLRTSGQQLNWVTGRADFENWMIYDGPDGNVAGFWAITVSGFTAPSDPLLDCTFVGGPEEVEFEIFPAGPPLWWGENPEQPNSANRWIYHAFIEEVESVRTANPTFEERQIIRIATQNFYRNNIGNPGFDVMLAMTFSPAGTIPPNHSNMTLQDFEEWVRLHCDPSHQDAQGTLDISGMNITAGNLATTFNLEELGLGYELFECVAGVFDFLTWQDEGSRFENETGRDCTGVGDVEVWEEWVTERIVENLLDLLDEAECEPPPDECTPTERELCGEWYCDEFRRGDHEDDEYIGQLEAETIELRWNNIPFAFAETHMATGGFNNLGQSAPQTAINLTRTNEVFQAMAGN
ncbi:MAG: hypothetical protein FWG65_10855 [Turicibacter sp.]|nr:hypothetical protein [Turicibacter sp.]